MVVYHGSSHNFNTLRLVKKNTSESTMLNEGLGIYFSSDIEVASSYGRYLYRLELNDSVVWDFRDLRHCYVFVNQFGQQFRKRWNIRIWQFVDANTLSEYLHDANIAIVGVAEEVRQLLLSSERFYQLYGHLVDPISTWLINWKGWPKAYFFPYNIKDCGVIKDVSPNIVRITGKEKLV